MLDSSFQGVNRLFLLAYNNAGHGNNRVERDSHQKYFLPRVNLTKFNILVDGHNFYDQPISDKIRKYDELRKLARGKSDDYTTGCLLDYKYFRDDFFNHSLQFARSKGIRCRSKINSTNTSNFMLDTNSQILTVLEKSKETVLEFYKGTAKVL